MFNWFRHKAMDRELTEILDRHQQVRRDAKLLVAIAKARVAQL